SSSKLIPAVALLTRTPPFTSRQSSFPLVLEGWLPLQTQKIEERSNNQDRKKSRVSRQPPSDRLNVLWSYPLSSIGAWRHNRPARLIPTPALYLVHHQSAINRLVPLKLRNVVTKEHLDVGEKKVWRHQSRFPNRLKHEEIIADHFLEDTWSHLDNLVTPYVNLDKYSTNEATFQLPLCEKVQPNS
ncbi:hypothetical protein TNCV_1834651, partial [Trichonephila clavipes]